MPEEFWEDLALFLKEGTVILCFLTLKQLHLPMVTIILIKVDYL